MSELEGPEGWPDDFCGKVRLFPLPNLVLFPHVVLPLHIFEPRYCDMLFDALGGDKLIAMALLEKGWEDHFMCKPKIASTVCVGKVILHTPTDDGRHNILLLGMKRGQIVREIDGDQSFRQATVNVFEDEYPEGELLGQQNLAKRLQELFSHFVPEGLAAEESFKKLVGKQLPLGILTDTITYALNLPIAIKQQLLAEKNVDIRCRILIRCLEQQLRSDKGSTGLLSDDFPPKFSQN